MAKESTRNKVMSNLIWRFAERCGAQGVSFIVTMVLARLLVPEDYGMVALINVIISIMAVVLDSGLGSALIQKKDADDLDFSTVFYFNMVLCVLLYAGMFVAAPYIAVFYKMPGLTPLVRVASLSLLISGVKGVQQAYVSRKMMFKRFFFATLGGTIFSAFLGIWLAYRGYGCWALVWQGLSNTTIDMIVLWITVKWRPKAMFSLSRLKKLYSYGWKMLASSLLDTVYCDLRTLMIGKLYTAADLAFYNKGSSMPNLFVKNINSSIDSVLLPTMADAQDNKQRVKMMTQRAIKVSTYTMAPMMMGLAAVTAPLVALLYTEKWLPCVPYVRICCVTFMFLPIQSANLNAIKAVGRTDILLRLETIKKVTDLIMLLICVNFGVMVIAYSAIVSSVMGQILNAWPNKKLLGYTYLEQLKDIMPSVLLSVAMGIAVYLLGLVLPLPTVAALAVQVLAGAAIYIAGSVVFRIDSFSYLLVLVKPFFRKFVK